MVIWLTPNYPQLSTWFMNDPLKIIKILFPIWHCLQKSLWNPGFSKWSLQKRKWNFWYFLHSLMFKKYQNEMPNVRKSRNFGLCVTRSHSARFQNTKFLLSFYYRCLYCRNSSSKNKKQSDHFAWIKFGFRNYGCLVFSKCNIMEYCGFTLHCTTSDIIHHHGYFTRNSLLVNRSKKSNFGRVITKNNLANL